MIESSLRQVDEPPEPGAAVRCEEGQGLVSLAGQLRERALELVERLLASLGKGEANRFFDHLRTASENLHRLAAPAA